MSRDYMLRMIEQIAAMLARILAKQQAGQISRRRGRKRKNLSIQNIGLTLTELKSLSPEAVAQLLDKLGGLRTIRAITLAELLLVDAELHEANQIPNQSLSNYVHAFCLLADEVDKLSREEQPFYRAKLTMLANRLGDLKTHPYIKARLRDFGTQKVP